MSTKPSDSRKPRLAIFDFACCEGCQLQIANMEEELLDLVTLVEPVEWREVMSDSSPDYDIAVIEGSITRREDEKRLKQICDRADIVIAIGACATTGGVNKLKNNFTMDEVRRTVYGDDADMPHLDTAPVKAVHEVVHVDYNVQGCPMTNEEFGYVIRCFVAGRKPFTPNYPVCVECKMRENVCRYEYGEVCLGVVTRAGCRAPCPTAGFWCFGCRGYVDNPNVNAAQEVMEQYGITVDALRSRMELFGSQQEHTP